MNPVYYTAYTVFKGFTKAFFGVKIINRDKLIDDGHTPCIYVCNHQSFLDPPLLAAVFENPVHFLARKTLFDHWFMKWALPLCNASSIFFLSSFVNATSLPLTFFIIMPVFGS